MNNIDDGTGKKESRIKLIRADSLGKFKWDYKQVGIGSSTGNFGSNDWTDSQLMMMLNPIDVVQAGWKATGKDYTIDNEGYVIDENGYKIYKNVGSYYNREKGYVPNKVSTTENFLETEVDFSTKGLTIESKNLIDKAKYYLGGTTNLNYNISTVKEHYNIERNKSEYKDNEISRTNEWTGYIGLMYPSDYGFATNKINCLTKYLYDYSTYTECYINNWLLDSDEIQWTISPYWSHRNVIINIYQNGGINNYGSDGYAIIHPVLYLKPDVKITSGNGTKENSFKLSL